MVLALSSGVQGHRLAAKQWRNPVRAATQTLGEGRLNEELQSWKNYWNPLITTGRKLSEFFIIRSESKLDMFSKVSVPVRCVVLYFIIILLICNIPP